MLTITNEDNMVMMARYPGKYFDLAIVDPPYGIRATKMTLGNGKKKIYRGEEEWDNSIPPPEYFKELFRVSKNQVIWGGNYMTEHLKPTSAWLFWDKETGSNDFADGELAWTSFDGALRKITKQWLGSNAKNGLKRIHPTEKPIYLYGWILNNPKMCATGFKILDTHLGSGSIAMACYDYGFDLTACEKDKGHYENAIKRLSEYTSQPKLDFGSQDESAA